MAARNKAPRPLPAPIRYRVVFNCRWLMVDAMTLGNVIFVRGPWISAQLLAHEGTHVQQFERSGGLWKGLLEWFYLLVQYGYTAHPWEQEARDVEAKVMRWAKRSPAGDSTKLFTPAQEVPPRLSPR